MTLSGSFYHFQNTRSLLTPLFFYALILPNSTLHNQLRKDPGENSCQGYAHPSRPDAPQWNNRDCHRNPALFRWSRRTAMGEFSLSIPCSLLRIDGSLFHGCCRLRQSPGTRILDNKRTIFRRIAFRTKHCTLAIQGVLFLLKKYFRVEFPKNIFHFLTLSFPPNISDSLHRTGSCPVPGCQSRSTVTDTLIRDVAAGNRRKKTKEYFRKLNDVSFSQEFFWATL